MKDRFVLEKGTKNGGLNMNYKAQVVRKKGAMYCTDCDSMYNYSDSDKWCPNCGNLFPHSMACMGRKAAEAFNPIIKEDKNDEKSNNDSSNRNHPPHSRTSLRLATRSCSTSQNSGAEDRYGRTTSLNWSKFKYRKDSNSSRDSIQTKWSFTRIVNCLNVHGIFGQH